MLKNKEHLTLEGLNKIVALKASLNKGLSDKLKLAFSDIKPALKSLIVNKTIPNPE